MTIFLFVKLHIFKGSKLSSKRKRWPTPLIPAFRKQGQADHCEFQASQDNSETLSQINKQTNICWAGWCTTIIPNTWYVVAGAAQALQASNSYLMNVTTA